MILSTTESIATCCPNTVLSKNSLTSACLVDVSLSSTFPKCSFGIPVSLATSALISSSLKISKRSSAGNILLYAHALSIISNALWKFFIKKILIT